MDISAVSTPQTVVPNPPLDQTAAEVATDDPSADLATSSTPPSQDLPSATPDAATSAPTGPANPTLSPEMQMLLLQTQEAGAAASLLMDNSAGSDPLLSMLGGDDSTDDPYALGITPPTLSPEVQALLAQQQGTSATTDAGTSQTPDPQTMMQLQSLLQGLMSSSASTGNIDATMQAFMDMLSGSDPASATTTSAPPGTTHTADTTATSVSA